MSEVRAVQKTEMPEINAQAAIVVTQHEGRILLEKNARMKLPPAFLTKITASIIALEKCNPTDKVTVSENVVKQVSGWKSAAAINLEAGEQISVLDLIYSMMLVSANDSLFALAEFICGGIDKFAVMMEEKAKEIGAESTVITSADGKFTSEQYSNAYDLAIICRYCMTNRIFRNIAASDKYTIPATNLNGPREIQNTNLLVNSRNRRYRYETAIGIKSGYTARSKSCLACSALPPAGKFGEEILAIILGAENTKQMKYVFYDAITLLDFTFDNYESLSGKKPGEQNKENDNSITTVSKLCEVLNAKLRNAADVPIASFAFGRQKIKPGCAYFADSKASAISAFEKGAAVVITDESIDKIPNIVVSNLEDALGKTAVFIKAKLGMWSIAVMDSPEKIDPLDMINQILSNKMETVRSVSVTNNYASMLRAMFSATKKTEAAVINVSCVNGGNVERVSQTANFDIAVLTSTVVSKNPRDLTKPELIDEKLKVCGGMNESGAVIINIDDKNLAGIFTIPQDIITIGVDNKMADYYADNIQLLQDKIIFDIIHGTDNYHIELYSDDKHSVYQALATFALGEIMGIPPKQIIPAIEKYRHSNGLNTVKNERGIYVISDFENDAVESVGSALKELCTLPLPPEARRIAVLSEVGDGDEHELEIFRKVGNIINKANVNITVCYGDISAELMETADLKNKFVIKLKSREALTEFLKLNLRDNDAILFKGSDSTELDDIMTEVT